MKDEIKYQQGDVLLREVSEIKGKKLDHLMLAKGENTGHKHQIINGDAELFEHEGTLFLRINSEIAVLAHEEHAHQIIERGNYQIGIVQEYDHFAEESKSIQD